MQTIYDLERLTTNTKLKFMKRIAFISLSIMAFAFISCGDNNQSGKEVKDNNTSGSETSATTQPSEEKGKVIHLTKAMFLEKVWNYEKNPNEWVYEGDKPCMIDFYADWCKPCRIVAPIMEELAEEYKNEIYVYKIDTQKERELAQVFQVTSIPRVLFCPAQGKPQMSVGALPKPSFVQAIEEVLLEKKSK